MFGSKIYKALKKELRARAINRCRKNCKSCNGQILCGNCKIYKKALFKYGLELEPVDCFEDEAIKMLVEQKEFQQGEIMKTALITGNLFKDEDGTTVAKELKIIVPNETNSEIFNVNINSQPFIFFLQKLEELTAQNYKLKVKINFLNNDR